MDKHEVFYEEFVKESDRAAVVLGAAKIDDMLLLVLKHHLVPSTDSKRDELLDTRKPIGTMGARIELVYRLGFITKDFWRSLHLIRKIRNVFAHDLEGCSFQKSSIRNQVQELY